MKKRVFWKILENFSGPLPDRKLWAVDQKSRKAMTIMAKHRARKEFDLTALSNSRFRSVGPPDLHWDYGDWMRHMRYRRWRERHDIYEVTPDWYEFKVLVEKLGERLAYQVLRDRLKDGPCNTLER